MKDPETHGAMLVPIILGSDKTTVSVGTGNNEYYPLYLSIGTVHNIICRAHQGAVSLIAFLAIPKSEYFNTWEVSAIDRLQPIKNMQDFENFDNNYFIHLFQRFLKG